LISLLSLAAILYLIDFQQLGAALRQANLIFLVAGIFITVLWLAVRALAWLTLLRNRTPYMQVFWALNAGYLLNNVLPFRLGEIGRSFLLSRKTELDFWQIIPTIVIERALDLGLAVGLLLATLPFVVGAQWAAEAAILTGILVLAGLVVLYLVARNRQTVLELINKIGRRWSFVQKIREKWIESILSGMEVLTDTRFFIQAVGLILLNWVIALFQYWVILHAFFPKVHLLWSAFSLGAGAMGVAPPSLPGGVGTFEGAVVGSLSLLGLNDGSAFAFALAAHATNYLVTGLLGGYALLQHGMSLSNLYRRSRQIQ
jgi:uncharacterized protein (TIRG00374 family)